MATKTGAESLAFTDSWATSVVGSCTYTTHDYDGTSRPIDGDGDGTATSDCGAFEYVPDGGDTGASDTASDTGPDSETPTNPACGCASTPSSGLSLAGLLAAGALITRRRREYERGSGGLPPGKGVAHPSNA
ncbi:MAG: hypothetical protein EXR69_14625 [Myxococcales bacterium]|nr:hypothetical protein [Myxococcales bacterium]